MGDTGPGGGTVFYVGSFTLTSTGQTMSFLEVARAASESRVSLSGDTSSSVTTSEALGAGAANTAAIIAQSNTAGRAATSAAAYNGPSYWSSSQYISTNAFTRVMSTNSSVYVLKDSTRWVRPIRAFG